MCQAPIMSAGTKQDRTTRLLSVQQGGTQNEGKSDRRGASLVSKMGKSHKNTSYFWPHVLFRLVILSLHGCLSEKQHNPPIQQLAVRAAFGLPHNRTW